MRWGTPVGPQLSHRVPLHLLYLLCQGRPQPCSSRASRSCVFLRILCLITGSSYMFFTTPCGIIASLDLAIHKCIYSTRPSEACRHFSRDAVKVFSRFVRHRNCHEDTHSFRNCTHPFTNPSGCLNTDLGQLGDDDAYRRWEARTLPPRRQVFSHAQPQGKSSPSFRSNARVPPGHGQVNSYIGTPSTPYTSGHHGDVPPSPASSPFSASPGMRLDAAHTPSGNPNARQPGTFRTGQ